MADVCHINGYCIKDRTARENIDKLSLDVQNLSTDFENSVENTAKEFESTAKGFSDVRSQIKDVEEDFNAKIDTIKEQTTVKFFQIDTVNSSSDDGDISLIQTKDKTILIDVGSSTDLSVQDKLLELGVGHIDYLIISHYHNDHIGGSRGQAITSMIEDGTLIDSNTTIILPHSLVNYDNMLKSQGVSKNASIEIKNAINTYGIKFLEPDDLSELVIDENNKLRFMNLNEEDFNTYYNTTNEDGETIYNNFSMVVLLESFKNRFLFSGDIEACAQSKVAKHLEYVDVYKIEHHALEVYSNPDYMNKISPSIAVCMPRGGNPYYSKFYQTPQIIKNKGGKIFDTFANGMITIESSLGSLNVWSERGEVDKLNYHLGYGVRLANGTDLNTIKEPGIYYSPSADTSGTLINTPVKTCGFKLVVEKINHEQKMVMQTVIEGNTVRRKVHKRKFTDSLDDFTNWGSITYFKQFEVTNEITEVADITLKNTSTKFRNYVRQMNGVVDVSLCFTVNAIAEAHKVLFRIPELSPETGKPFLAHTKTGAMYPCYLSSSDNYPNEMAIVPFREIPAGTELYMSFTYVKDYKSAD